MSAPLDIRIVVLPYGHVVVGLYELTDNLNVTLSKAHVIRRWGTSVGAQGGGGLPLLARDGPRPDTVLDGPGTCRLRTINEIATWDCNVEKWASVLEGGATKEGGAADE